MDDQARRHNMVEKQLRPSNVADLRVLAAMEAVPRPPFLPTNLRGVAYSDDDIRIGDGRFLIEPLVLARLLQLAAPRDDGTALVVGCDTGYAAAVLARLTATVFLTASPQATDDVEARLMTLEAANVIMAPTNAPLAGHAEAAPYDVMLAIGQIPDVPTALTDQLADGGRLVAVIGSGRVGRGTIVERIHGHLGSREVFDAATPPMRGVRRPVTFEL
ncbi:MAG: protein-L-isoaspartate O-methyltransferase [Pseudomonadota bacterium]